MELDKSEVLSGIAGRTKQILDLYKINGNEAAARLGMRNTIVYKTLNGKSIPNYRLILDILSTFPRINPTWYMTGEGPIEREITAKGGTKVESIAQARMMIRKITEHGCPKELVLPLDDYIISLQEKVSDLQERLLDKV